MKILTKEDRQQVKAKVVDIRSRIDEKKRQQREATIRRLLEMAAKLP